jgi:hypothetical protein
MPKQLPGESFYNCSRRIGAYMVRTLGTIGHHGTKVHRFTMDVVDTDDGLGIVSLHSMCGSAKWNSHLAPNFNDSLECTCKRCGEYVTVSTNTNRVNNKQEEVTMTKPTVKQIKAACDLITEASIIKTTIHYGARTTLAAMEKLFLAHMEQIDAKGKLDDVPADAWDVYTALKPAYSGKAVEAVNYEDTPEGKDAAGENTGTTKANAAKDDAKQIKKEAADKKAKAIADDVATVKKDMAADKKAKAEAKAAKAAAKTKADADKPKKFTKAMAFWGCLKAMPITNKTDLAEALREAHGNGSAPEAKFWTQNYLNLLVETGLVEVKGQNVTFIER